MQRAIRLGAGVLLAVVFLPTAAFAGGAWLPGKGNGDVQGGFSRKQADTSWDANGDILDHTGRAESHDFRYGYVSGDVPARQPPLLSAPGASASVAPGPAALTWRGRT
jgi:hypothetical protein